MARPARVVLFVIESLRREAPERLALPAWKELAAQGSWFKTCTMTLPTRIQNDPLFGTVIPNLSLVTGTVLWKRMQFLTELFNRRGPTVHVAAFPSYRSVDGGSTWSWYKNYPDLILAFKAFEKLEELNPAFLMVHPQMLMHGAAEKNIPPGQTIWSEGSEYRRLALEADRALRFFVQQLQRVKRFDDTLLVVVGDHGVADTGSHPPLEPQSWFSTLLLVGPGVRRGQVFEYAECLDVAPTICRLAGLPAPEGALGRVLEEALEEAAAPAGAPPRPLLGLHEVCREFAAALAASRLPEARRQEYASRFAGEANFVRWGEFSSLAGLIEHNRQVLGELRREAGGG